MIDTIGEVISASARRHAKLTAIVDENRALTYAELLEWSARLAQILHSRGLTRGKRVAVLAEDRVEAIGAYLGVWLSGATVVHVNARLAVPEIEYQLEDSLCEALLHTPGLASTVASLGNLDDLRVVLNLDDRAGTPFAASLANASRTIPEPSARASDIAVLGYTSGTSGRPKGAMISHRALTLCTRSLPYFLRMPMRGRLAYSGSVSLIGAVQGQVLPHLYIGGMVRLLGKFSIDSWFSALRQDRSTFTFVASPLFPEFTERMSKERDLLDHLVTIMHGGSIAPRNQVERLVDVVGPRYVETYGSTEIVGSVTATTADTYSGDCPAADPLSTVGLPLPTADVSIERPDGTRADAGEEGEIIVGCDTLFDGYWRDPAKTALTLHNGRFQTGDVGSMDGAGYVYVSGRNSELIVSGGFNVYPAEVERVILEHPAVAAVAVLGLPHPRWGEGVTAVIVPRYDNLTEDAIVEHCRSQLASYKKPTRVIFADDLPLNPTLKVDKSALRERFSSP